MRLRIRTEKITLTVSYMMVRNRVAKKAENDVNKSAVGPLRDWSLGLKIYDVVKKIGMVRKSSARVSPRISLRVFLMSQGAV